MKLNHSGVRQSRKFAYSNLIILAFSSLYLLFPYFLLGIVGPDFYIYSPYQKQTILPTIYFFCWLFLSLVLILNNLKKQKDFTINKFSKRSFKIILYITLCYLLIIALRDLPLKLGGASRNEMLGAISAQLLPGFGFVLLLCMISIIQLREKRLIIVFCIICFIVDLVHEGKIFMSYALLCLMFYLDDNNINISFRRVVVLSTVGVCFLLLIFFMRAYAVGENPFLSVYSFFSEFMGVNATSGWAIEYNQRNLPSNLSDFDATLKEYYVDRVGHGLALSPVAYFLGNFGSLYYLVVPIYCVLLTIISLLGNKLIGKYCLLVILYNLIHLLRHGPNLFLSKCIFQIIFLALMFSWLNHVKYTK